MTRRRARPSRCGPRDAPGAGGVPPAPTRPVGSAGSRTTSAPAAASSRSWSTGAASVVATSGETPRRPQQPRRAACGAGCRPHRPGLIAVDEAHGEPRNVSAITVPMPTRMASWIARKPMRKGEGGLAAQGQRTIRRCGDGAVDALRVAQGDEGPLGRPFVMARDALAQSGEAVEGGGRSARRALGDDAGRHEVEQVLHACGLGEQIGSVLGVDVEQCRHPRRHDDAVAPQPFDLRRVVGQQPHLGTPRRAGSRPQP